MEEEKNVNVQEETPTNVVVENSSTEPIQEKVQQQVEYTNVAPESANGFAVTSLVLGIISLVDWIIPIFAYVTATIAIIFGIGSRKGFKRKSSMGIIGMVMGIVGLVLALINSILGIMLALQ